MEDKPFECRPNREIFLLTKTCRLALRPIKLSTLSVPQFFPGNKSARPWSWPTISI